MHVKFSLVASVWLIASFFTSFAGAQTPSLGNSTPAESFAGEQFCFDAAWTNTGTPGFGPYIRLVLPPDITFDSAMFLGTSVSTTAVGIFPAAPGNQLVDPRSGASVTGPDGGTLTLLVLPLGSVVTGGANIVTRICTTISTSAAIGVPLDVSVQPVYEFGDTATGDNGPVEGSINTAQVTPTLILASKTETAPESERPPGASFPYNYVLTVDVANGQTVDNVIVADTLPADVQYVGPVTVTGGVGASVDVEPSTLTPGGALSVSVTSLTGTTSSDDLTVSFPVHITDTLDEMTCTVEPQVNALTVDADFAGSALPQITDDTTVTAKHVAIQKGVAPGTVVPGDTVTFTINFQVTEFGDATNLVLTDVLEDGFTFDAHTGLTIGGTPVAITPGVSVDGAGVTTLTYDIGAVAGTLAGPTTGQISYTATIDQLYTDTGLPLNAQDAIGSSVSGAYDLTAGATACSDGSGAGVTVADTAIVKEIVNPQAEYQPGDVITFRLTKTIPSGDTRNVVFEDFFPLPVLDATSIDLTFGNDVTFALADTLGIVPSISVDGPTNSLTLGFGDVNTTSTQTISVEVDITVVDEPFADGLFLTNLFQATNSNTPGEVAVAGAPVQFNVRAPDLQITKGVSASNNPTADATISPSPAVLPVDGDIANSDAGDTITFVITVENQGGASAFDVLITDAVPAGLTGCAVASVANGDGTPLANSGDLFGAGLLLTDPLAGNDGTIGAPYSTDTALLTVMCDVDSAVNPQDVVENTSNVTFASLSSATTFPPRSDSASVTIATPSISKSIDFVSPGSAGPDVTAGDTVGYRINVTLPEGQVGALSISDALPAGFEFQSAMLDTTGFAGSVSLVSAVASGTVAAGQTVAISFGATTTVTPDNNAANNSFVVVVDALVRDVGANDGLPAPQSKVNTATLDYTGRSGVIDDTATVDFAEPELQLTKTMSPDTGLDAGDTVTITLLLENTGTAPAYDLSVTDTLNDAGTLFDLATVSEGTTPAGFGYSYANPTVSYTGSGPLAAGGSVTFIFTAQVIASVQTGSSFGNTANASADSQAGVITGERTTVDSGSDMVTVSAPDVAKSLIASSEAWTSDTAPIEAAIGEVLTYEARFDIPEGLTFAPMVTPIITDTLPAGQAYLAGTALVRVEGVATSFNAATYGPIGATDTVVNPSVNGQVLEFDLGGFTNSDSDVDTERLVLTYDVLVENTSDNNRTDNKTNVASLNYLNRAGMEQSVTDSLVLNIAEPNLILTKTASPTTVTGGSVVTFTIVADNESGANVTRAWEPVISDTLPARYQNIALISATLSRGAVDVSACASVIGNTVTLTSASCLAATEAYLDPDDTITLQLTADIDPTIQFNEQVTNTSTVTATSLPGANGTGGATPGVPGDANGERTGTGVGANDLDAMDSATVTANQPTITKSGSVSLQVGETTTMMLTVDLPVGTTSNFVVTDDLPAGLSYTGSPITITTPSTNFVATNSPSTIPGTGTDPLVFDFGNITNSDMVTQSITIAYEVQVENVLGNQNLTALTNTATLSFTGASPSIADTATVTVVEPNLEIAKSITSGAAGSDAGDTIGYQVAIQNTSTVGTAYRVDLRDVLPADLLGAPDGSGMTPYFLNIGLINPGNAVVINGSITPLSAADAMFLPTNVPDDTLTWPLFDLPPNTTLTVTYDAVVTNDAPAGAMLVNDVTAGYHSLEDGGAAGRDGSGGSDDDSGGVLNNYNEADSVTLNLSTDIAIQKSLNAALPSNDFTIGDLVTFDLRVDVIEGITGNVVVTDVLPAGLSFEGPIRIVATSNISFTGPGIAVEAPTGTLTIDLADITNLADGNGSNDFLVIEVDARVLDVPGNATGNTITNSASLTSDLGPAGPDTVDIDIVEPALAVTKVPNNPTPALGETVTWTITVQHQPGSGADAFDVLLVDVIPAGLTYVPGSHSGDGTVDETDPGAPEFDLGSITLAEMSKTFTFDTQVDLDATVGSPITNNIGLGWDGQSGDPVLERSYADSGSGEVTPATPAFVDAQKTVAISTDGGTVGVVDPGDTLEYTVTLTNTGPTVTNAVFTDTLPTQTTYVAASLTSSQGTTDDSAAPNLSVDLGTLTTSTTVTITFQVTVNAGTPTGTIISNQGFVDSDQTVPEPTDVDGVDSNGDQPTDIPVGGASPVNDALYALKGVDLFSDNDSSGSVTPNDTLEYFFLLVNEGPNPLTGVTLSDTIPTGLTYVAASAGASPATGSVSVVGANVTASFPGIDVGATALVSFQVTVDDPLVDFNGGANDETFVNQAVADSDQTEPVLSDGNGDPSDGNQPTSIQAVDAGPGTPAIDVEKRWSQGSDADGDGLVDPGDEIAYTIIVTNTGSATATNVRLTDSTPVNTTFVAGSASTSQGAVVAEDPLSVNIGTLEPGGLVAISFRVAVSGGTPDGTIIANQANVTGDGGINENSDDNGRDDDGINPTLTPVDTGGGSTAGTPGGLSKALVASSEADSAGTNVQIGEVATYQLGVSLPAGTLREVSLFDTLPTGLGYVPGTARLAREFDTGLITSRDPGGVNGAASGTFVPLADGSDLTVTGNAIEVFLGDVINSDNDMNDERIVLQLDVVTENVAANQAGTALTNQGSVSYFNQLGQPQSLTPVGVTATVIEPQVTIAKAASPSAITTAGGDVQYTLVVTGQSGALAATGYDIQVTDALPAAASAMAIDSITPAGGTSGITDNSAGTMLDVTVATLPPGGSVTIVYTATYPAPQAAGTLINNADLTWSSLPGTQGTGSATPGNPGDTDGERTGSGAGPNDYLDMDMAIVTVGSLALDKFVVDPQTRYAIGDTIDYRVEVAVPPGVNLMGTTLSDVLDPGLEYVTGSFSLTLDAGLSITNTPVDFTRTDNVPVPGEETLTADLGTLSNAAGTVQVLTVDYGTRVENVLSNQDNQGLDNDITLSIMDTGAGIPESLMDSTSSTVGEPRLALNKALTSPTTDLDAGDIVSFEVAVSNTGTTTAYEVILTDMLPAGLENVSALTVTSATGGAQTPTLTNNGSDWQSSPFDLPVGATVTVTFDAELSVGVVPGEVIQNTVQASFTSRDGSDPNERDGSDPGSDQDDDTDLDNYNVDASAPSFTVADPVQIDKGFVPDASNDRYTIGEVVTYRLTASFIEGTLADLVLTDDLPATVRFESATVSFGNLGMTAEFVPTGMEAGNQVTFDFGDVTNPANGNPSDDFLTVDLLVTVLDVPGNVDGAVLGNNASLTFTGPGGTEGRDYDADAGTPGIQPLDLTVIEPNLQLLKSVNPGTAAPGALLRYTLVLDHTAASTADAFDLRVVDTLPAGLTYVPGSASIPPTSVAGQVLTFDVAALTLAADQTTITYEATVDAGQMVGIGLTNVATLTYSTLPGGVPDERGYTTGDDATVTVSDQAPDLSLVKDDGGASTTPGGGVIYTLNYANVGSLAATGVLITETVPANTRFDAPASSGGWTCSPDNLPGAVCTLPLGSLAVGASGTAQFGLLVDTPLPAGTTAISNTASISDDGTQGFDLDPGNNSDTDSTPLLTSPALGIDKQYNGFTDADASGDLSVGDVLSYTVVATNIGDVGLINVVVSDPLLTPDTANCAVTAVGETCILTGTYVLTQADLDAGGVNNTATAQSDETGPVDDSVSVPIAAAPALDIVKSATNGVPFVNVGDVISYQYVVQNVGNVTITDGIVVTDDRIAAVSCPALPAGGLAPGDSLTCTASYMVTEADLIAEEVTNVAFASAGPVNSPTDTVTVPGSGADLQVIKSSPPFSRPGAEITYTLVIRNDGPSRAIDAVLTDPTPAGLVFLGASAPCEAGFPCSLGDLDRDASVEVEARYRVEPRETDTTIENTATVSSTTPDPDPDDNVSTTPVSVQALPMPVPLNDPRMLVLVAVLLALSGGMAIRRRKNIPPLRLHQ